MNILIISNPTKLLHFMIIFCFQTKQRKIGNIIQFLMHECCQQFLKRYIVYIVIRLSLQCEQPLCSHLAFCEYAIGFWFDVSLVLPLYIAFKKGKSLMWNFHFLNPKTEINEEYKL